MRNKKSDISLYNSVAPTIRKEPYRNTMITHRKDVQDLILPLNLPGDPLTFASLIEDFCFNGEKMIRQEIRTFLEKMDEDLLNYRQIEKTIKKPEFY